MQCFADRHPAARRDSLGPLGGGGQLGGLHEEEVTRLVDQLPAKAKLPLDAVHSAADTQFGQTGFLGDFPKGGGLPIMIDGDMDAGVWSCGMVAGLIRDVPSCKELVDRIMAEAESLITRRLAGFVGVAA